jgi:hypothetical protein
MSGWTILETDDSNPLNKEIKELEEQTEETEIIEEEKQETEENENVENNEEPEKDSKEEQEQEEEEDDDNVIGYLAKTFSEKGILSIPEGKKVESEEDLDEVISHTIKEGIEAYKDKFEGENRTLIEFLELGGTLEEFIEGSRVPDISNVDLSEKETQKTIYKAYLESTLNIADPEKKAKKIQKLLDDAEIEETLQDEAEEAKAFFIQQKKEEDANLLKEAAERKKQEDIQKEHVFQTVKNLVLTEESINDIPLGNKKDREALIDWIFTPNVPFEITENGKKKVIKITGYQAEQLKVNKDETIRQKQFLFHALALKNGFDFTPIKKKGVTEHNKSLLEKAENYRKEKEASSKGTKKGLAGKNPTGFTVFDT